jgi:hypothetical protein
MDVRVTAPVNPVQNPGRERRPEITMQRRHCPFLDAAAKPAAHDEFRAFAESLHKRSQLPKIISKVRIAHDNPFAPDVTGRIDIGAAEAAFGSAQNFASMRQDDLGRPVG